jgi:hypothetical protein
LVGGFVALAAIATGIYYALKTLILGVEVPGFATLVVMTALLGGLMLAKLGLVGLYIGRIYEEVKGRPLYIIRRTEADLAVRDSKVSHLSEAAE